MESGNIELVRDYLAAVERFDAAAAGGLLADDILQTEHPNKLYAGGQVRRKEALQRDLSKGAAVLRSQRYPIDTVFAAGDRVAVETRWEGVLNVPLGRLRPGDTLVAHICMIFTIRDGRIVAQRNYDCYEDFA